MKDPAETNWKMRQLFYSKLSIPDVLLIMHTVVDGGVVHFINFHCEQVDVSVLDASCGRGDSAAPPPPSVANGFVSKYGRCVPENWKKILLNHSVTHPIFFKILFFQSIYFHFIFLKKIFGDTVTSLKLKFD